MGGLEKHAHTMEVIPINPQLDEDDIKLERNTELKSLFKFVIIILVSICILVLIWIKFSSVLIRKRYSSVDPIPEEPPSVLNPTFVLHRITEGKEFIELYNVEKDYSLILHEVEADKDNEKDGNVLANIQVSSDKNTIFFCKYSDIWSITVTGENLTKIVMNVWMCDYSVIRSFEEEDKGLIFVGEDENVHFYDFQDEEIENLTLKFNRFNLGFYTSPIIQNDILYYIGNDRKIYKVPLDSDNPSRTLIHDKIISKNSSMKMSSDGCFLLIRDDENKCIEVINLFPADTELYLEFLETDFAFISNNNNGGTSMYTWTLEKTFKIIHIDFDAYKNNFIIEETYLGSYNLGIIDDIELLSC